MSHLECMKSEKGSARTEPKIYQQLRDGTGAGIGERNRLRQEETRILEVTEIKQDKGRNLSEIQNMDVISVT